jgi:hypothetical protein
VPNPTIENLLVIIIAGIKTEAAHRLPRTHLAEMMLKENHARGPMNWVAITSKAAKQFGSYYELDDAELSRFLSARRCTIRQSWLRSLTFRRNVEFPFGNSLEENSMSMPSLNLIKE